MTRSPLRPALAAWSALCLFAGTGQAASNKYLESFTTTTYKDAVNTTALWDTGTGTLKLPPFDPSPIGGADTPGPAVGVAIAGDLAFIADGASGLQIIDITNAASPSPIGTYNTPGSAAAVAVAGDHVFVADGSSGLQIISIVIPTGPLLVGTYNTPGTAGGVAVAGDLAFIADGTSGLQVINIVNPASPSLVGTYNTPGTATGVEVAGDLAFVADGNNGLQIINITNPAVPALVSTYDTPGTATGVTVDGDLAYIGDAVSGLQIISISNPVSPSLVGTYNTPGFAYKVAVAGDLAVVADGASGIEMLDVTNPASPVLVDTHNTTGFTYHVAASGTQVFLADGANGLQIVEMMTLALPVRVGEYNTPLGARALAVAGDLVLAVGLSSGLYMIGISDPTSPTLAGSYNTPGVAQGIAVAGDLAFVADLTSLQIINITNPALPALVGSLSTPGDAYDVAVAGDLAFVADGSAGLQVISIANPALPALVGTANTDGFAQGVAVAGDLAFVADGSAGIEVINIANPASPTIAGIYNTPGFAYDVAVAGDLAFVADALCGLQIIDVVNPVMMLQASAYDTPVSAYDVKVAGDFAFVTDSGAGLQIVDITDPTSPTLADTGPSEAVYGVAVSGELVFTWESSSFDAIQVFNHQFYTRSNIGRSLAIDGTNEQVLRARLSSTQTAGVTWELSANAGTNWQSVTSDNAWNVFTVSGSDLRWRSAHGWTAPGLNPTVSDLQIEWLYQFAVTNSVTDIPDDQGGRVYVELARSGYDFTDVLTNPVTLYGIYRRVDNPALVAAVEARGVGESERVYGEAPLPGVETVWLDDTLYVPRSSTAATFPPGTWALVATVPATQSDSYLAEVTTTADSSTTGTNYSVFVVTTHTTAPSVWFISPPDSGYSVDNIAPAVPANLAVAYNTGSGNTLSWNPSPDDDFQYFRVYRSTDPNFTISPATLVHATTSTGWADPDNDGGGLFYKVTALDYAGNESDPAVAGSVTAVEAPAVPHSFALFPNAPNPFNPTTQIRYDVPERGGVVSLRVYNVDGSLVKTLVEGTQSAGEKSVAWDGRDETGQPAASGVYFYRLEAPDYTRTRKMVLLK